jgi:hypothetical protein
MYDHGGASERESKKGIVLIRACGIPVLLPRLELFDCSPTLLKEDAVATIRATYVDVDLDLLFAPCTFIGADHG